MDYLEWVEKAALENLRGRLENADALAKEAHITLTILLTALGASFAYSQTATPHAVAAYILTSYLCLLSIVLTWNCLMIREIPALTNEPRNLRHDDPDLDRLRGLELDNIQERINQAARRNVVMSQWLNGVRMGLVGSPIIFAISVFFLA